MDIHFKAFCAYIRSFRKTPQKTIAHISLSRYTVVVENGYTVVENGYRCTSAKTFYASISVLYNIIVTYHEYDCL